ncbi:MAG: rod shape-determining protein MreC [Candidatus Paceibacterota bacterium]
MRTNYPQRNSFNNSRNRKRLWLIVIVLFFLVIFTFSTLSARAILFWVGKPFWKVGSSLNSFFSNSLERLKSKSALIAENQLLQSEMTKGKKDTELNRILIQENTDLKDLLGRKSIYSKAVLASILVKPSFSPYDTLIVDIGTDAGVVVGDKVSADGNIFIGRVSEVYANSSKVILYSSPDEKVLVLVGSNNVLKEAVGIGGGNFKIELPREIDIKEGDDVVIPSISPNIFGIVEKVEYKEADSFQTVLFKSPINVLELKWVEILIPNNKK